jgi:hypothetical protein
MLTNIVLCQNVLRRVGGFENRELGRIFGPNW